MPKQLPILALVLCSFYWPWQFFSGDEGWLVTVVTVSFACVMLCNIFCKEIWVIGVMIIGFSAMLINATLFFFGLHEMPIQSHITLAAFIIELLIITMSLGAAVGRIRNDGLHNYLHGVGSLFNYSRSNHSNKEIA